MARNAHRLPGELLLGVARHLLPLETVAALVAPAVADLQHEWLQAKDRPWQRRLVLLRGYLALTRLLIVSPFVRREPASVPAERLRIADASDRGTLGMGVVLWLLLLGSMWPLVGNFVIVIAAGTVATAIGIHRWHCRHAGRPGIVTPGLPGRPEINFAAIPVYGNMAGLLVVIGSLAVIAAGLPALGIFLLMAALIGAGVATALRAWHVAHPAGCPNSIVAR